MIEPLHSTRAEPIGPTDSGAEFSHAQFSEPIDCEVQAMILEMKPLADAKFGVEMIDRWLGSAIGTYHSHIEVTVVSAAFALFVTGRCLPLGRQIEQAVPENSFGVSEQQFGRALEAKCLDFIGSESGDAYLRYPNWEVGYIADFLEFFWPVIDLPMIPIQGKAMHRHGVQMSKQTVFFQQLNESRINRRYPAQD